MSINYHNDYERPSIYAWERVIRTMVDPITFSVYVNVDSNPRIEDCSYETTYLAYSQPRLPFEANDDSLHSSSSLPSGGGGTTKKKRSSSSSSLNSSSSSLSSPRKSLPKVKTGQAITTSSRKKTSSSSSSKKKQSKPKSSLDAFFSKSSAELQEDDDNQSISSKSMTSRSISDRSNAERSSKESKVRRIDRPKNSSSSSTSSSSSAKRPSVERQNSRQSMAMQSIDEHSAADFSVEKSATPSTTDRKRSSSSKLGKYLEKSTIEEDDKYAEDDNDENKAERSVKSNDSDGKSKSSADGSLASFLDKNSATANNAAVPVAASAKPSPSKQQAPVKGILKKTDDDDDKSLKLSEIGKPEKPNVQFIDEVAALEIPRLTDSLYSLLFYGSEELADFRYEAFLEEAGLDPGDYM